MFAFLIDVGAAYLIADSIKNLFFAVVASIVVGIGSSALGAYLLTQAPAPGTFGIREAAASFVLGLIWHPVATVIAMVYFRRKRQKANEGKPVSTEKPDPYW